MSTPLQIKRGLKATLPEKAALGEPLITTDTHELFVGQGTGESDGKAYKLSDVIFSATEPAIIKEKIWVNTTDNSLYRASDDGASWVKASGASTDLVTETFQVFGVTQGVYHDGSTIPAGTPLADVVKNMLQAVIPPTYLAPTLSLSGNAPLTVEAGTSVTPTLSPTFVQHDGGAAIVYTLKRDGADLFTSPTAVAHADDAFVLGDASRSYQANITYNEGPVKNDNQSNPYPTGRITAGMATSSIVTYAGKRNLFYGFNVDASSSTAIRSLSNKLLGPANATTFTLNIPAGTTRVSFAYPATLRDVTSVKYVELGNGEVKDTFVQTLVDVEGAAGFTAQSYKVYNYVPAIPFGDAVTYQVVI